jgi:signal recognition particle subunit SRP54
MTAIRKMGPIANILAMVPGMGQFKDQMAEFDDRQLDRITAIVRSMTPGERVNTKIINASRRVRIARGSGVTVTDVNQLLTRFAEAQKMMKQMGGMMGLPGARRKATKSPKNKRKGGGKGGKGGGRQRGSGGGPGGQGLPAGLPGLPGGFPALPPGLDPAALDPNAASLPPGVSLPKLDFSKFRRREQG